MNVGGGGGGGGVKCKIDRCIIQFLLIEIVRVDKIR